MNEHTFFDLAPDGWFQISGKGEFPHKPTGLVQIIDDDSCQAMLAKFGEDSAKPNFPGILIDFDHFSLEQDKPSEAAGWIVQLDNRPDGLWAQIRWSDKGEEAIRGGRYRFISPVFRQDECVDLGNKRIRPIHLVNAAVTNDPNITGMVPLSNANTDKPAPMSGQPLALPSCPSLPSVKPIPMRSALLLNRAVFLAYSGSWELAPPTLCSNVEGEALRRRLPNRSAFSLHRSAFLRNWGKGPLTDEQRRAMFARFGGGRGGGSGRGGYSGGGSGSGGNRVPSSVSSGGGSGSSSGAKAAPSDNSPVYVDTSGEHMDPMGIATNGPDYDSRGVIRAPTWQDSLCRAWDAVSRVGDVGPGPDAPAWQKAMGAAIGMLIPLPGGKARAIKKAAATAKAADNLMTADELARFARAVETAGDLSPGAKATANLFREAAAAKYQADAIHAARQAAKLENVDPLFEKAVRLAQGMDYYTATGKGPASLGKWYQDLDAAAEAAMAAKQQARQASHFPTDELAIKAERVRDGLPAYPRRPPLSSFNEDSTEFYKWYEYGGKPKPYAEVVRPDLAATSKAPVPAAPASRLQNPPRTYPPDLIPATPAEVTQNTLAQYGALTEKISPPWRPNRPPPPKLGDKYENFAAYFEDNFRKAEEQQRAGSMARNFKKAADANWSPVKPPSPLKLQKTPPETPATLALRRELHRKSMQAYLRAQREGRINPNMHTPNRSAFIIQPSSFLLNRAIHLAFIVNKYGQPLTREQEKAIFARYGGSGGGRNSSSGFSSRLGSMSQSSSSGGNSGRGRGSSDNSGAGGGDSGGSGGGDSAPTSARLDELNRRHQDMLADKPVPPVRHDPTQMIDTRALERELMKSGINVREVQAQVKAAEDQNRANQAIMHDLKKEIRSKYKDPKRQKAALEAALDKLDARYQRDLKEYEDELSTWEYAVQRAQDDINMEAARLKDAQAAADAKAQAARAAADDRALNDWEKQLQKAAALLVEETSQATKDKTEAVRDRKLKALWRNAANSDELAVIRGLRDLGVDPATVDMEQFFDDARSLGRVGRGADWDERLNARTEKANAYNRPIPGKDGNDVAVISRNERVMHSADLAPRTAYNETNPTGITQVETASFSGYMDESANLEQYGKEKDLSPYEIRRLKERAWQQHRNRVSQEIQRLQQTNPDAARAMEKRMSDLNRQYYGPQYQPN